MKEKIKSLYNKALEKYTYSDCDGDNNHGIRLNAEKFAELIIKETLEVVRDEVQYALDDYLADTIDIRVKNHFGVE